MNDDGYLVKNGSKPLGEYLKHYGHSASPLTLEKGIYYIIVTADTSASASFTQLNPSDGVTVEDIYGNINAGYNGIRLYKVTFTKTGFVQTLNNNGHMIWIQSTL